MHLSDESHFTKTTSGSSCLCSDSSRRGKGVKGLDKGGAKRHRTVLRNKIKLITKPTICLLDRHGGVKGISDLTYMEQARGNQSPPRTGADHFNGEKELQQKANMCQLKAGVKPTGSGEGTTGFF
ncbi:hypothetical protein KSP39_PZI023657 [Platanthera zijinensis]|uniref:Uncharacterized protein n=1 Tax=Platanthera zijinensis TaxID=2320716 RepID=A0AAP0FSK9_9ASPA